MSMLDIIIKFFSRSVSRKIKETIIEFDRTTKSIHTKINELEELTLNGEDEWFLDLKKKGDSNCKEVKKNGNILFRDP